MPKTKKPAEQLDPTSMASTTSASDSARETPAAAPAADPPAVSGDAGSASPSRLPPVTSEATAILDNERANMLLMATAFESVIDDLADRHDEAAIANLVVRPEEWALLRSAGPTESDGTPAIRTRHDLLRQLERRLATRRMLDDLGGHWPAVLEAAQERLAEASEVLTHTRADLQDLEVEAVEEPALEAQLRVLTRRLAELRKRQSLAASEVARLQSLHTTLCTLAPPILRQIVEQRTQDLGVAAAQAEADQLERTIAEHRKWLDRSSYLSLRRWTEPYQSHVIVWQFVENKCPEALDQSHGTTRGDRSLRAKVWHAWLDELEDDLPNKEQQLEGLRADTAALLDKARAPLHAWMNAKRLELDMLQPTD
ncbi:hypothetical protein [Aeoliella sp.]|uniref:hypothetical protein n=1 Tax=Aeoliella sp. TaxID=2795800 RepID=UPI003CCB80D4